MKHYKHEYCLSCKQENPQDQAICKCGGRNFVFGDYISIIDDKIQCECGSQEFKMTFHMNSSPIYNKTYKCDCGKSFGMQTYVEDSYGDYEN